MQTGYERRHSGERAGSFSSELRAKIGFAYDQVQANFALPKKHDIQAWFKNYLVTTHSIIRASVPLMQAAHARCRDLDDDLAVGLARYYEKHSVEESNHDEWLLDDLYFTGVSRHEALSRMPSQTVAELVGSQYYWIYYWHPVCLLGYISYLEGNPPEKKLVDQLQKMTGYPEQAFRTIRKHSDLDPHHRDDLNDVLDALPLDARQKQWITSNALYTAAKLVDIRNRPFHP